MFSEEIPDNVRVNIQKHILTNSWPDIYYDVLQKVIKENDFRNVLEIGVALGGHAETLLQNTFVDKYYGIDPYRPYDNDGFSTDVEQYDSTKTAQQCFDYLFDWVRDVRLGSYRERCLLIRKPSVEASSSFSDHSLDCIFVDGDHSYEAVFADLSAWFPKVRDGGMILGDDYWMEPVARAVGDYFGLQGREVFFYTANSGYKIWAVSR